MPTEKERELARALGPFEMTEDQFLGTFGLLQEDDHMIQLMIDWIAENPGATTRQFLRQLSTVVHSNPLP